MAVQARVIAPATVREGAGEFTFKIEWQDVSILQTSYAVQSASGGSAVAGSDFYSFSTASSLLVSQLPAGPYAESFSVSLIDDRQREKNEVMKISVSATGTLFSNGMDSIEFDVVILDNDTPTKGADILYGNNRSNTISGLAGKDTIYGYGRNDKINGGYGNDTLSGGSGKDTFVFDSKLNSKRNSDRITDFFSKDDTIQLDHEVFSKLKVGRLASSAFQDLSMGKADSKDRILYDKKGNLFYDQDGSGNKHGAVKFAHLDNHPNLNADDFIIV